MVANQISPNAPSRRSFLRIGLGGFTSLGMPGMLRLRAQSEPAEKTAIILVWLRGGPSHLETFDPKPNSPSDYRGPYKAVCPFAIDSPQWRGASRGIPSNALGGPGCPG